MTSVFIFNLMGYWGVFFTIKYQIEDEIKSMIKQNVFNQQLYTFKLPIKFHKNATSGITWVKENKEFRYKNQMYDVVKRKFTRDSVYYYCINDKKEEKLFTSLYEFVGKNVCNDVNHNKNFQHTIRKLLNNYFFEDFPDQVYLAYTIFNVHNSTEHFLSLFSERIFPPPKINS